jgi:hypothetical protein
VHYRLAPRRNLSVAWGHSEKNSQRAYVFRNASDSCQKRAVPALTFNAITGHSIGAPTLAAFDSKRILMAIESRERG